MPIGTKPSPTTGTKLFDAFLVTAAVVIMTLHFAF
jgi:hypothetical protein